MVVETTLSVVLASQLNRVETTAERMVVGLQLVQDGSLALAWGVHAVSAWAGGECMGGVHGGACGGVHGRGAWAGCMGGACGECMDAGRGACERGHVKGASAGCMP